MSGAPTLPARFDRWLVCPERRPAARIRLFCFPYAGGGAFAFMRWAEHLPKEVELIAIQPPGREDRRSEPAYKRADHMVEGLVPVLRPFLDRPYVFFGHSMGSLIAFETTRVLRRIGTAGPAHLVASAHHPPHDCAVERTIYDRSDAEFIVKLRSMNGTPEELLENQELLDLYLPLLRSDFEVNETYTYRAGEKLACPIAAFSGTVDPEVDPARLDGWAQHTARAFTVQLFPGSHFFIHTQRGAVLHALTLILKRALVRAGLSQASGTELADAATRGCAPTT